MKKIAWWNSVCIKHSLPLNICHENNKTPHSNVVEHQRNNARLRNYQRGHSHKLWLITQLLLSILRILFSLTSQLIHLHANLGISFINARPEWILVTSQQCARVYYQPAACLLTSSHSCPCNGVSSTKSWKLINALLLVWPCLLARHCVDPQWPFLS